MLLEVWYRNLDELTVRLTNPTAFVVALAVAKDYRKLPRAFEEFVGLFRVIPTGIVLGPNSMETEILERVRAREMTVA